MAKLVLSLFFVSLLSFLGVSQITLPNIVVPVTTFDFLVDYSLTLVDIINFSTPAKTCSASFSVLKIGKHLSIQAQTDKEPLNNTDFPFGVHVYRDDLKALYSYGYASTASSTQGLHYRCEKQPETTLDAALNKYMNYIDLAHSVRGKPIFTSVRNYSLTSPVSIYSYEEDKEITEENYDRVKIIHSYYCINETGLCVMRSKSYYRHLKDGDYEYSAFATETIGSMSNYFSQITWEAVLAQNIQTTSHFGFFMNLAEYYFAPNVAYYASSRSLVCPEIDHLPVPRLIEFLPNNYTEYQFIFENPVYVPGLMENVADILNLTNSHPERVSFSQIEKLDKEWAVDIIVPTDLGEILATAVENRDVRKSGYELVAKVKKMVAKK